MAISPIETSRNGPLEADQQQDNTILIECNILCLFFWFFFMHRRPTLHNCYEITTHRRATSATIRVATSQLKIDLEW